jgi:hypothetical protein
MTAPTKKTVSVVTTAKTATWFALAAGLIMAVVIVLVVINPLASFLLGLPVAVAIVLAIVALLYGFAALMLLMSSRSA